MKQKRYGTNILIASLAVSGIISITTGAVLNKLDVGVNNEVRVEVVERSLKENPNGVPKLKQITIEENIPLSVNVKDYIENINEIGSNVLNKCTLDTSLVNVRESGVYTYTITYKDKKYNGTVTVTKKISTVDTISLKEISIEVGKPLSTDVSYYVNGNLTDDIKNNLKLDLNSVNTTIAGTYQYSITYLDRTYTGKVTVYEANPIINDNKKDDTVTDNSSQEQPTTTDNNQTQEQTQTQNENQPELQQSNP